MPQKDLTPINTAPVRGGIAPVLDDVQRPFGALSTAQNVRPIRPGFRKRPGQRTLHTTADGTNKVLSIYQFRKQKVDEKHFFAQWSDNDVMVATTAPPGVTTGAFGSEIFSGSASSIPASWTVINDILVFSNGVDQHQIYGGDASYVDRCVVYKGTATIPNVPEEGFDYTAEVQVNDTGKVADIGSLGTDTDNAIMIKTPVQANSLTFDLVALNSTTSRTATVSYRKNDQTWADTSNDDGIFLRRSA